MTARSGGARLWPLKRGLGIGRHSATSTRSGVHGDRLSPAVLVLVVLGYGVAFALLHQLAALWATSLFYTLWFPAAGLRFAALYWLSPRYVLPLASSEAIALWLAGVYEFGLGADLLMIGTVVSPPLAYALAIALAQRLFHPTSLPVRPHIAQFALAVITAPLVAFFAIAVWHRAMGGNIDEELSSFVGHALVFYLGDLLGIVIIAPPLLWAAQAVGSEKPPKAGLMREWAEAAIILGIAGLLVWSIELAGYGLQLVPMVVAVGVIGFCFGRVITWASVLLLSAVFLWRSALDPSQLTQIPIHMHLTSVALVGYMAASYAEDRRRRLDELRAKDRALLQSERLKTLRAMSVSIIHELSQPLSTLSLETHYLARLSDSPADNADEIKEVSEVIARKTDNLSTMVRRLRSFGTRGNDEIATISIEDLFHAVVDIIAAEARSAGVRLEIKIKKDLFVQGQDVELQQALANLLRNAIAASPAQTVQLLSGDGVDGMVKIDVINTPAPNSPYPRGMGVGKLIVEAVAEMHGGALVEEVKDSGERRMTLLLPAKRSPGEPG